MKAANKAYEQKAQLKGMNKRHEQDVRIHTLPDSLSSISWSILLRSEVVESNRPWFTLPSSCVLSAFWWGEGGRSKRIIKIMFKNNCKNHIFKHNNSHNNKITLSKPINNNNFPFCWHCPEQVLENLEYRHPVCVWLWNCKNLQHPLPWPHILCLPFGHLVCQTAVVDSETLKCTMLKHNTSTTDILRKYPNSC